MSTYRIQIINADNGADLGTYEVEAADEWKARTWASREMLAVKPTGFASGCHLEHRILGR